MTVSKSDNTPDSVKFELSLFNLSSIRIRCQVQNEADYVYKKGSKYTKSSAHIVRLSFKINNLIKF